MNFDQLLALAILFSIVVLGVVITVGNFSVMSAILYLERSMRRQKAMEREDRMREQLQTYVQTLTERLEGNAEAWRGVALQMLARATGKTRLGSEDDLQVVLAASEPPKLVIASSRTPDVEYLLTTTLQGWKRSLRRKAIPLDAVLYPEARLDAYALWAAWVRRLDPQVEEAAVVLRKEAPWWLIVVPRERN